MNKTRFIPALALVCLLYACGTTKGPSMGKPKFAKAGSEISAEDFKSQSDEILSNSEFGVPLNFVVGEREITAESYLSEKINVKRNGKAFSKKEDKQYAKSVIKSDKDNYAISMSSNSYASTYQKDPNGVHEDETKGSGTMQYQPATIEDKEYYTLCYQDLEEYIITAELNDSTTAEYCFNYVYRNEVTRIALGVINSVPSEQDLIEKTKFYRNGNVFTYETQITKTENIVGYEDESVGSSEIKQIIKGQYDMTEDKWLCKYYVESTAIRTFVADSYAYLAGDVVTEKVTQVVVNSIVKKDVTVKPLDISKYRGVHL